MERASFLVAGNYDASVWYHDYFLNSRTRGCNCADKSFTDRGVAGIAPFHKVIAAECIF